MLIAKDCDRITVIANKICSNIGGHCHARFNKATCLKRRI